MELGATAAYTKRDSLLPALVSVPLQEPRLCDVIRDEFIFVFGGFAPRILQQSRMAAVHQYECR